MKMKKIQIKKFEELKFGKRKKNSNQRKESFKNKI